MARRLIEARYIMSPNSQRSGRPLVLVVDDDARAANVLVRLLRGDGFDVELATDGAAALERLNKSPAPRALITDLWLPKVDGASVARYAQRHVPDLAIFIVTGHPNQISSDVAAAGRPLTVFTKPLDYSELHSALCRAAGRPFNPTERAA